MSRSAAARTRSRCRSLPSIYERAGDWRGGGAEAVFLCPRSTTRGITRTSTGRSSARSATCRTHLRPSVRDDLGPGGAAVSERRRAHGSLCASARVRVSVRRAAPRPLLAGRGDGRRNTGPLPPRIVARPARREARSPARAPTTRRCARSPRGSSPATPSWRSGIRIGAGADPSRSFSADLARRSGGASVSCDEPRLLTAPRARIGALSGVVRIDEQDATARAAWRSRRLPARPPRRGVAGRPEGVGGPTPAGARYGTRPPSDCDRAAPRLRDVLSETRTFEADRTQAVRAVLVLLARVSRGGAEGGGRSNGKSVRVRFPPPA